MDNNDNLLYIGIHLRHLLSFLRSSSDGGTFRVPTEMYVLRKMPYAMQYLLNTYISSSAVESPPPTFW